MSEYYFNLPIYDDLNDTQKEAVLDPNAIALSGGPGTGKSVVSLWRHILNHQRENPVRSQLLTFTTSLALYLKRCCRTQNQNASDYVDSSINWRTNNASNRQEILHDEAQDLSVSFNSGFLNHTRKLSYGADDQQLIRANSRLNSGEYNLDVCSPEAELRRIFPTNSLHTLDQNYRNTRRIMKFAKSVFNNAVIPHEIIESCTNEGEYPRLIVTRNANQINQTVLQLVNDFTANNTTNIGILVPFENANRMAGETATARYYYDFLHANNIDVTMYTNAMNGIESINTVHVTTFKSSKGLEFDVVIIPDFHLLNVSFNVVDWRDFYVGVTRAKANLFLLSSVDFPHLPSDGINKVIDKVLL